MGGGTHRRREPEPDGPGLSPRGRGNLQTVFQNEPAVRSIPAWAGEPSPARRTKGSCTVYPRVGGGTAALRLLTLLIVGLSPRGRGNRQVTIQATGVRRSIPAWAGEPAPVGVSSGGPGVYPRVGGGTGVGGVGLLALDGLSPRGRGNQPSRRRRWRCPRSIPAWAGEPAPARKPPCASGVYPRVGGGTDYHQGHRHPTSGLSPRGRGNPLLTGTLRWKKGSIPAWAGEPVSLASRFPPIGVYPRVGGGTHSWAGRLRASSGLSPRGRGNHHPAIAHDGLDRSIPAWAGEPPPRARTLPPVSVYPRVGGGTVHVLNRRPSLAGLSPRGRGNRVQRWDVRTRCGSIPAWAGEPLLGPLGVITQTVYPRVGGGTGMARKTSQSALGLSPRGRGNPHAAIIPRGPGRSIPAWAGEPTCRTGSRRFRMVYPRVGGGTGPPCVVTEAVHGLSPRGRGNRRGQYKDTGEGRSIPAWAGEPRPGLSTRKEQTVYPRVGGGTSVRIVCIVFAIGLSPRGRGNRAYPAHG